MNNKTRKEIDGLIQRINDVQLNLKSIQTSKNDVEEKISELNSLVDEINEIQGEISCLADDEQSKYDCMPENLQFSERGEALQDAADSLSDASCIDDSEIQDIIDSLNDGTEPDWDVDFSDCIESLEEAKGV